MSAVVNVHHHDPAAAVPHFRAYLTRVEAAGPMDERTRGVAETVRRKLDATETALAARAR